MLSPLAAENFRSNSPAMHLIKQNGLFFLMQYSPRIMQIDICTQFREAVEFSGLGQKYPF